MMMMMMMMMMSVCICMSSVCNGVFRVALTMTVSAFWHGVHAGYYLSFLTIPPTLIAEDLMMTEYRPGDDQHHGGRTRFDWVCWFFKMRAFEYMSMSFLLLGFTATLRYWWSVYFIGHVVITMFIIVGYIYRPRRRQSVHSAKTDWTLLLCSHCEPVIVK